LRILDCGLRIGSGRFDPFGAAGGVGVAGGCDADPEEEEADEDTDEHVHEAFVERAWLIFHG
jgi:hypothetical protein